MVPDRFLNVFGSSYDFIDEDSYHVCSTLMYIFQVVNDGENLLLSPMNDNKDDLNHL